MRDSRTYSLFPSDLDFAMSFRNLRDHCVRSGYQENLHCCSNINYSLIVDSSRHLKADDFEELLTFLEQHPRASRISVHSHWENSKNKFCVGVDFGFRDICIYVECKDLNIIAALHEKTREFFKASNPQPDKSPQVSKYNLKKSVFLAHRFDGEGQRIAGKLSSFLSSAGFSVTEGEGYENRDIPEKIEERILSKDIFICVATPGDQSWILSEATFAKAKGKYLIMIVQEGVEFNKGIIGSGYEHMSFNGENIEKCFTGLLYALP